MRHFTLSAAIAALALGGAAPAFAQETLTFVGGSAAGYYTNGIGGAFVDLMHQPDDGRRHRVVVETSAGSFEIIERLCAGTGNFGVFQADAYALRRTEDRSITRCMAIAGQVREEAVLVAAPTGTTWRDFRGPNVADTMDRDNDGNPDQKWTILVKEGSGAMAPAQLIPSVDQQIASNVIFEIVPAGEYDFDQILADIDWGDIDGVMWVQSLDPNDGDMGKVSKMESVDFVSTGFAQYADQIQVGGRRKAPVYRVAEMPVESNVIGKLDLLAGGGRKMDLLMVAVLAGIGNHTPDAAKAAAKTVFTMSSVAPATSFAQQVMDYYASGMAASKEAWAAVAGDESGS